MEVIARPRMSTRILRVNLIMDSDGARRIRAWQESLTDGARLPSTQLLVSRGGRVVYYHSTGQAYEGRAVTDDNIFRIFSMTKPIVSVALMMLVEQGSLVASFASAAATPQA